MEGASGADEADKEETSVPNGVGPQAASQDAIDSSGGYYRTPFPYRVQVSEDHVLPIGEPLLPDVNLPDFAPNPVHAASNGVQGDSARNSAADVITQAEEPSEDTEGSLAERKSSLLSSSSTPASSSQAESKQPPPTWPPRRSSDGGHAFSEIRSHPRSQSGSGAQSPLRTRSSQANGELAVEGSPAATWKKLLEVNSHPGSQPGSGAQSPLKPTHPELTEELALDDSPAATWKKVLEVSPSRLLRQSPAMNSLHLPLTQTASGAETNLTEPLLANQEEQHKESQPAARSSGPSRMVRNLLAIKTLVQQQIDDVRNNPKLAFQAAKLGFAAGLTAVVCVLDDPWAWLTSFGIWAVVTVDLVTESNIGTSLSKGINRTFGTLGAGILALILSRFTEFFPKVLQPGITVIFVFFGAAVPFYFRFRPPFKDRWNYALSMMMITFHMLLLSNYRRMENYWLPTARFSMILFGFFMASLVGLAIVPVYAGDSLHALASKNLESTAEVLERCVCEYAKGTVLDHVPNIASGRAKVDDKIYNLYHQIVMSDADVDRLLAAIAFEPSHGRFFSGYPWKMYDDLMDALRYLVYDIIALDGCLRAEIQAPLHLRMIVGEEMRAIGKECAQALRLFGSDLKAFRWSYPHHNLKGAELAALQLQHKMLKHITAFLMAPRSALAPGVFPTDLESSFNAHNREMQAGAVDTGGIEGEGRPEARGLSTLSNYSSTPLSFYSIEKLTKEASVAEPPNGSTTAGRLYAAGLSEDCKSDPGAEWTVDLDDGMQSVANTEPMEDAGKRRDSAPGTGALLADGLEVLEIGGSVLSMNPHGRHVDAVHSDSTRVHEWMQRQESLARNWDRTVEQVTALSLVKFVSLLLEIVAKMSFVIEKGQCLAVAARFTIIE